MYLNMNTCTKTNGFIRPFSSFSMFQNVIFNSISSHYFFVVLFIKRLRLDQNSVEEKIKIKTENTFVCKVDVLIERCEYNSAITKHWQHPNVCVCVLLLLLLLPVANFIVDFTTDRLYCMRTNNQTKISSKRALSMCKCVCVCVCVNEISRWACDRANKKGKTACCRA